MDVYHTPYYGSSKSRSSKMSPPTTSKLAIPRKFKTPKPSKAPKPPPEPASISQVDDLCKARPSRFAKVKDLVRSRKGPLAEHVPSNLTWGSLPDKYSDLTIVCGGREFNVHKLVICTHSKPFASMIDDAWGVSCNDDNLSDLLANICGKGSTNKIMLEDDEVEVVYDAITFLYTAKLTRGKLSGEGKRLNDELRRRHPLCVRSYLTYIAKLYVFGDKWDIEIL